MEDLHEVVMVGFSELDPAEVEAYLERVGPQEQLRRERLDQVLEPGGSRGFYLQAADDNLFDEPPKE